MAEKDQILKEELEHDGIFDFKALYSYMHDWLVEKKHSVDEEKYAEKNAGNTRDIDIDWKVTKRLSDYFKTEYKIVFEIKGMSDVEVEIDGRTKKMNKGKLKLKFTGTLVMDHGSKWETSPFTRFTRDLYNKFIIPSRVDSVKGTVERTVKNLKDNVKAYLDLTARR